MILGLISNFQVVIFWLGQALAEARSGGGFVVGLGWLSASKEKSKEKQVWYEEKEEKKKIYIY